MKPKMNCPLCKKCPFQGISHEDFISFPEEVQHALKEQKIKCADILYNHKDIPLRDKQKIIQKITHIIGQKDAHLEELLGES